MKKSSDNHQSITNLVHIMKNIAIIGLGYMGKIHMKEMEKVDGARIAYVSDNNANVSNCCGIKGIEFYADAARMIEEKGRDIDGIIIATPTETHETYCALALANNIPVFVEKPCGNDKSVPKNLKNLENTGSRNNTKAKVHVGCQCRFMAPSKKIIEVLDNYSVIPESINVEWTKLHKRSHSGAHYDEAFHSLDLVHLFSKAFLESVYATLIEKVVEFPGLDPQKLVATANFALRYTIPGFNSPLNVHLYAGMHEPQEIRKISINGIVPSDKSNIKITGWFSDTDKILRNEKDLESDILTGMTAQCMQVLKTSNEKDGFSKMHMFVYPGRLEKSERIIRLRKNLWEDMKSKCAAQNIAFGLTIEEESTEHVADELKEWVETLDGKKSKTLATLDDAIKVHEVISLAIESNKQGQVIYRQ